MSHLTPEELIDAIDTALPPDRRGHLDECEQCRGEASRLRALLSEVRGSDVPEPSPLFWDHLSARIRTAIDGEALAPATRRWFDWPVLAPLAGLAVLVLVLVSTVTSHTVRPSPQLVAAVSPDSGGDDLGTEAEWRLLAELVGDVDLDAAPEEGISLQPGTADTALLHLTLVEQQELMRLLREELRAGG